MSSEDSEKIEESIEIIEDSIDIENLEPLLVPGQTRDERYFALFMKALNMCLAYKPMFGKGKKGGYTLQEFQSLYAKDPFYHWIGLDSPAIYAAHKTAGGMTSIYRQLGIGGEWIFRAILRDSFDLSIEQTSWSYSLPTLAGKPKTLTLDGRLRTVDIPDSKQQHIVENWLEGVKDILQIQQLDARQSIQGCIFEVRQGYKSMDSKRQNADIDNAANAYLHHYVPILILLSQQMHPHLIQRYSNARILFLNGTIQGSVVDSTYTFCREVLGYDLAAFFEKYSTQIKNEVVKIVTALFEV